MKLSPEDLTIELGSVDPSTLLAGWDWLLAGRKRPVMVTAMGEAFVQDVHDGSVHLLSCVDGSLTRVADDQSAFSAMLGSRHFIYAHFAPEAVAALRHAGIGLGPGQVYGFKHPPMVGGSQRLDNREPAEVRLHFSMLGQLSRATKDLPPGTRISGFRDASKAPGAKTGGPEQESHGQGRITPRAQRHWRRFEACRNSSLAAAGVSLVTLFSLPRYPLVPVLVASVAASGLLHMVAAQWSCLECGKDFFANSYGWPPSLTRDSLLLFRRTNCFHCGASRLL